MALPYATIALKEGEDADNVAFAVINGLETNGIIQKGEDVSYRVIFGRLLIFRSPLARSTAKSPRLKGA